MIARILLAALPLLASAVPAPQPDLFSSLVKRADAVIPSALSTCDVAAIKMDRKLLTHLHLTCPPQQTQY